MYQKLLDKIKKYKKITIFRHERPDGDAVFSSYALKEFIKSNFKNKQVYLVGSDSYDILNSVFKVKDSIIKDSLCIVLDTATKARVDDKRCFELSDYLIKIDHHPAYDNYGDLNYVDPTTGATCELLTDIFFSKTFSKYKLNNKVRKYLFCGIVTDTMSFKTASCTERTYRLASKLLKGTKINPADIYNYVFSKTEEEYLAVTKLRKYYKSKGQVAYIIVNKKDMNKIGISYNAVKNNVDILANIQGIKIWAIFAYNKNSKLFDGSVRSMNGYVINGIARRYNGGGHKYAIGVKNLKISDINRLINEFNKLKKPIK